MTPSHQLILPINIGMMIPEDDSVRLLAKITDELDYKKFHEAHNRLGRPASNLKVLVRVLLYGAMNGIWSSRRMETACRRDINFIWLLDGHKAPDHNTLSRFRSGPMGSAIEDLFLLCFGFNINKLHHKMNREKQGVTLFELKAA